MHDAIKVAIIGGIFTIIAAIITMHSPSPGPSVSTNTPTPTSTLTEIITKDYLVGDWKKQPTQLQNWTDTVTFYPSGYFEKYTYFNNSQESFFLNGTYQLTDSRLTLTSSQNVVQQWNLTYIDQNHFSHDYRLKEFFNIKFTDVYERQLT